MLLQSWRGALLGAVFSLALGPLAAHAETPNDTLVVAQSIDDATSFDPAEGFELTTVQSFNNLYQRLVQSNRDDGTKIEPALAASWEAGSDGKSRPSRSPMRNSPPAIRFALKTSSFR